MVLILLMVLIVDGEVYDGHEQEEVKPTDTHRSQNAKTSATDVIDACLTT